jgi:hypothetical protein
MSKYDEYDQMLIAKIKAGKDTVTPLEHDPDLRQLAEPHRSTGHFDKTPYFRVVDKRLQALRKQGAIGYENKRWVVKQP